MNGIAFALVVLGRLLAALSLMLAGAAVAHARELPPNVIIIFADDLGYGDIGVFGAKAIATPHLDAMAREGMRFTEFYVPHNVCTPSRAALLTGRYPVRHGISGVLSPESRVGLPLEEVTIAEALKTRDYATGLFGKWHLGHVPQYLPTAQGFDRFFGAPFSNDMSVYGLYERTNIVDRDPDQRYLTRRLTEATISFIEDNRSRPFFVFLAHPMPHIPLFRSPEFEGRSAGGLYGDVIEELDWSVGELRASLERLGLTEKTLIIFTSDNGPWLTFLEHAGSAGVLRGGKFTIFEGGHRVPTIAAWPGVIPPGIVQDGPMSTLDLLPTITAWADAPTPSNVALDGLDLRAVFEGREAPPDRRALAYYQGGTIKAVRRGDWKLVLDGEGYQKDLLDIGWPAAFPDYPLGLYNLRDDPSESANLAEARPDIVAALRAEIAAIRARVPGPATPIGPLRQQELGLPPNLEGLQAPENPSRRYRNQEIERRRAQLGKAQ